MKISTNYKKIIGIIISILLIYLLFLFLYLTKNNSLAFPNPNNIIKEAGLLLIKKETYISISLSILRLLLCLLISFVLGLVLASLSFFSELIKNIINPYILIFRSVPVVSLIILFIILFGNKEACLFITCLMLVPIFYENIYQSFLNIDPNIVRAYKIDSNFNLKILFKIYIPESIKDIKTSFIECVGLGFKVLVMSEYLSGKTNSLGYSILEAYQNNIDMVYIYSWTLILVILSVSITKLCNLIKNKS